MPARKAVLRPISCACAPRRRKLGQVGQIRALGEGDLDRVDHVGPRPGADAGGPDGTEARRSRGRRDRRAADHPGAVVEHGGLARRDSRRPASMITISSSAAYGTVAGSGAPWARSWTWPLHGVVGPVAGPGRPDRGDLRGPRARRTGPTVTVLVTGVMSSTYRGRPSAAGAPSRRPRRCPMVNWWEPECSPTLVPSTSTMSPAVWPSRPDRKPAVSPSAMKQMSWLSGLSATASPRSAASARTWDFRDPPSGK